MLLAQCIEMLELKQTQFNSSRGSRSCSLQCRLHSNLESLYT
jgi:hypothetical protein